MDFEIQLKKLQRDTKHRSKQTQLRIKSALETRFQLLCLRAFGGIPEAQFIDYENFLTSKTYLHEQKDDGEPAEISLDWIHLAEFSDVFEIINAEELGRKCMLAELNSEMYCIDYLS